MKSHFELESSSGDSSSQILYWGHSSKGLSLDHNEDVREGSGAAFDGVEGSPSAPASCLWCRPAERR
jgi:hypothetical protein